MMLVILKKKILLDNHNNRQYATHNQSNLNSFHHNSRHNFINRAHVFRKSVQNTTLKRMAIEEFKYPDRKQFQFFH